MRLMRKRPQVVPTEARPSGGIYSSLYNRTSMRIWLKKYKIVGEIYAVSACGAGDKKIFKNSDFSSALPSLLVEMMPFHSRRLSGN